MTGIVKRAFTERMRGKRPGPARAIVASRSPRFAPRPMYARSTTGR